MLNIIVAVDRQNGIAKDGKIPWHIPEDLRFFSQTTKQTKNATKMNAVIMGKKTWKSIPKRGLSDRINIIVSNTMTLDELENDMTTDAICILASSLDDALTRCDKTVSIENVFVIGGVRLYTEVLSRCHVDNIYITKIDDDYGCNLFFPHAIFKKYLTENNVTDNIIQSKNNIATHHIYHTNSRRTDGEYQYLNLLEDILRLDPDGRQTRNAVCHSIFGPKMLQFDLSNNSLPLLTTRRIFFRGILEELLWFLVGDTNANHLSDKGIKIWNGNTSRKFLDSVGLKYYKIGDIGPLYGFQLRYASSEYNGMNYDYIGQGFDQLRYVIDQLKRDPHSRRIIMTTFNAKDCGEGKCCLYPCHGLITQFYVRNGKYLDCYTYSRSQDVLLGTPFNIASYSILVHIISYVTQYIPGKLLFQMGDAHIYSKSDHLSACQIVTSRTPYESPKLQIKKKLKSFKIDDIMKFIETLTFNDFKLIDYKFHPSIKINMVV